MKIAVTISLSDEQKRWFEEAAQGATLAFIDEDNPAVSIDEFTEVLKDADAIVGNIPPAMVSTLTSLQWLQVGSAGTGSYMAPGVLPERVVLTNATGAYGLALSEHMLAQLLSMMKKLYTYYDQQKECYWKDEGAVTSIYGSTAIITGFGDIGKEFGKRLKALGCHVIGIRRRSLEVPPEADEMGHLEDLPELVKRADIVANCLPDTPATRNLFGKDLFQHMKKGTWFVNVGRGNSVVQEELIDAVEKGIIAGASLDVTSPEPLPPDHPMWKVKNIFITPHVSGGYHLAETKNRILRIACRNIRAYIAGKPLENIVDRETGYKK